MRLMLFVRFLVCLIVYLVENGVLGSLEVGLQLFVLVLLS